MLELLVALAILVTAMAIIWATFAGTLKAWTRGNELLDHLHHGDFVIEQLVLSLRSAAFFKTSPGVYGFRLESQGGDYEQDEFSWVTSGSAFIPPDSPLLNGLYRINVTVGSDEEGDRALLVWAYPHLAEEEDTDIDPWPISSRIKGISCRAWNAENEDWDENWEDTNTIPGRVEITLFMDPIEEYGPPIKIQRLVEIPLAIISTSNVSTVEQPAPDEQPPATQGESPTEAAP
jgi:hypothetical protein